MITIKTLNNSLSSLKNRINFDKIANAAITAQTELQSTLTTTLGSNVGSEVGGFQSLTQEIDGAVNSNEVVGGGVSLITNNPSGVNLVEEIPSPVIAELTAIAGLDVVSGINQTVVSASTPEAIGATVSAVSNKDVEDILPAIIAVSPNRLQSLAGSAVVKELRGGGIGGSFVSTSNISLAAVQRYLDKGMNQPVKDLIEEVDQTIKSVIINLTQSTGKIIPLEVIQEATGLIDNKQYKPAAELIAGYSDLSKIDIETELNKISTSVKDSVQSTNAAFDGLGTSTAPTCVISQYDSYWNGADTSIRNPGGSTGQSWAFTYISSLEELEAELRSATREITETVIHWTANYTNQATVGAEQIHNVHLQRGFSGCGYHYIIKRDGRIQRGRPLNRQGAHALDFGHNRYSIGISHVAGYNCTSGTPNPNRYISSDSINTAQWSAQRAFLTAFYRVFPGGQVLGHYQCTTSGKVDPGFDVDAYIRNTFNKTNALQYANNYRPLSRQQLIVSRTYGQSSARGTLV